MPADPSPAAPGDDAPVRPDPVTRRVNTVTLDDGDGASREVRVLITARTVAASPDDVWAAVHDPQVVAGWPGEAHGDDLESVPAERRATAWVHAGREGRLDVSLRPVPEGTLVQLDHTDPVDPEQWRETGPAPVGLAWERALADLAQHLAAPSTGQSSDQSTDQPTGQSAGAGAPGVQPPLAADAAAQEWARAAIADGDDPDRAREAARRATS